MDILLTLLILNHALADIRNEERKKANKVKKQEETEKVIVVAVSPW